MKKLLIWTAGLCSLCAVTMAPIGLLGQSPSGTTPHRSHVRVAVPIILPRKPAVAAAPQLTLPQQTSLRSISLPTQNAPAQAIPAQATPAERHTAAPAPAKNTVPAGTPEYYSGPSFHQYSGGYGGYSSAVPLPNLYPTGPWCNFCEPGHRDVSCPFHFVDRTLGALIFGHQDCQCQRCRQHKQGGCASPGCTQAPLTTGDAMTPRPAPVQPAPVQPAPAIQPDPKPLPKNPLPATPPAAETSSAAPPLPYSFKAFINVPKRR